MQSVTALCPIGRERVPDRTRSHSIRPRSVIASAMLPRCEPRFAYAQAIDSSQHDAVIESLGVCRVQLGIICPPTELVWGIYVRRLGCGPQANTG